MTSYRVPLRRTHALARRALVVLGIAFITVVATVATAAAAPVGAMPLGLSALSSSPPRAASEPPYLPASLRLAAPQPPWAKCLGGTGYDEALSINKTADKGYILAGVTFSSDGDAADNHGGLDAWVAKLSSKGSVQWQRCLGGTENDGIYSIYQTADGGYILAGYAESNDGDAEGNHGDGDAWVVKLSSRGDIQWQRCLGGTGREAASSIHQTADKGYILGGYTYSNDNDVKGNRGNSDAWVVKLSPTGTVQWQKCLGGSGYDCANSIQQTADKGYILGGSTRSNNGDAKGNHGGDDAWVVKLSSKGSVQWQRCLGGTDNDETSSIHQTADKGYILAGATSSSNGDVVGNRGISDAWVVKLSSKGSVQWKRCLGGSDYDCANSIHQTADGGYILGGYTESTDGNVSGNHGDCDAWVVKLSSKGSVQWQRCLGGTGREAASSIQQTADRDYIFAGFAHSSDGDVTGNRGNCDAWVVKLSPGGAVQWKSSLGGSGYDCANSIQQTADKGYILAGVTHSSDGDVKGNHGDGDAWVVKLSSKGSVQWKKCLGGSGYDCANSLQQTADKGYILAGYAASNNGDVKGNHGDGDVWVVKLSSKGSVQWQRCFGGTKWESASSIHQTADKGYILGGATTSSDADVVNNRGGRDAWVVKLSSTGNVQWQRCLGGTGWESASSIRQTADKGYILGGNTFSNDGDVRGNHGGGDAWVAKLSSKGSVQWQRCFGGAEDDEARSIHQTTDKGYILAGFACSNNGDLAGNNGGLDIWVVKLK